LPLCPHTAQSQRPTRIPEAISFNDLKAHATKAVHHSTVEDVST